MPEYQICAARVRLVFIYDRGMGLDQSIRDQRAKMLSENSIQIVRWVHFPTHCEPVPLRFLYFNWRLISETSAGEQDKQYHKDSPRFETEPGVSDRLNVQHGDQAARRVADAVHKH